MGFTRPTARRCHGDMPSGGCKKESIPLAFGLLEATCLPWLMALLSDFKATSSSDPSFSSPFTYKDACDYTEPPGCSPHLKLINLIIPAKYKVVDSQILGITRTIFFEEVGIIFFLSHLINVC